ncbi:MAG: peptidoglycan DD-metalloendopeptidase family protein [Bacteroidales bacterium]|nr:peptidoglycan DD-metalloendopeptidase family protein [Bacteroidales bacterium]
MKRIVITIAALVSSLSLSAQSDTVLTSAEMRMAEDNAEAIDTIDTRDRYTKIVLYKNYTWQYVELDRPNISDDDFQDDWDSEAIHAYKDVTLASLPAEIDLMLVDSTHGWACPKVGQVNSGWKFRRHREHKGTDIQLNTGDPIYAAFDGKVRVVREVGQAGGYGNLIVIRHANGLETYYAHLSKHLVREGDLVKAGEEIGLGGSTGRSTGPHLHFEVRYMGKPFDPERIFDFPKGELRDTMFTLKKHYFNIYSHYGQTDRESASTTDRVVHVIKQGDTLGAIARRYHTTVTRLCQLNHIKATTTLRLGQRIVVR